MSSSRPSRRTGIGQTVDRLSGEAARRGGTAIEDIDVVTLQPPQDSGELVRVVRYVNKTETDQTVRIETGFAYRLAASLNDPDDIDHVCMTVFAILDGHATEVAEVAKDGTWLGYAAAVETPDGGAQRATRPAPAFHLAGVPVDHEHRRQIDPWPRPAGSQTSSGA